MKRKKLNSFLRYIKEIGHAYNMKREGRNRMIIDMNYWYKVIKRIFLLLVSVIGIYLFFKLSIFYLPFLIAFVLSLLIEPAIKFLMRKLKLKRKTSSIFIFLIVLLIIGGGLVWGITTIISEASSLLQGFNNYFDKLYIQIQEVMNYFSSSKFQFSEQVNHFIQESTTEFIGNFSNWIKNGLTNLLNFFTQIPTISIYVVITLLSLYFICTDKIYIMDQVEHHLPPIWAKKIWIHLKEISKMLGCYLKAEATLVLVSFIISIIGLYIFQMIGLNIHYPLLIALGIGFVDALPILGSGSVMIPWAILVALDGDIKLGIAIMILWGIMSIVRQFIEPRIVSHQLGIHPIFTLLAMYTGFRFMGIIGILLGPIILIILKNIFATLIDQGIIKSIFDR